MYKRKTDIPSNPTQDIGNTVEAAERIVQYIQQIGSEFVFGVPGGAIEPIYNALARSERSNIGQPRAMNACHETGAAFMADGYFRATGKLGVCIGTSGPGATNMITGVACAYDNHIPMLVITGQPALPSFGKKALQESGCTGVNVVAMFQHCTHYNSFVSHPDQVETKIASAILKAYQLKGPVHLSIPVDILRSPLASPQPSYDLFTQLNRNTSMVDVAAASQLAKALSTANQPIFFIGYGANDAIDAIMQLVEMLNLPFMTTPDAKGLINPQHTHYYGVFGLGGHDSAVNLLRDNQEPIIAFGTSFDEFSSSGWSDLLLNHRLIHIDSKESNLVLSPMAKFHVKGCIGSICDYLLHYFKHNPTSNTQKETIKTLHTKPLISLQEPDKYHSEATPIKPQRLMKALSEMFPNNTRFVADAGNSMVWAPHYLQPNNRRQTSISNHQNQRSGLANWLLITMNFAPMGWAIGAAIGVARGNPNNTTVCITGDGSYLMSGQEISVAVQENLPVVFVILNDSVYGMVMHGQRIAKAEAIAYELPVVDYKKMVEAMGIPGHIIRSPSDFTQLDMAAIQERRGPTLLDIRIDREEVPPMVMRLKTLGTFSEDDNTKKYSQHLSNTPDTETMENTL